MLTDPNPEEDLSAENHSKKDVVYAEPNLSEKFVQLTEDKSNFFFRNSTLPWICQFWSKTQKSWSKCWRRIFYALVFRYVSLLERSIISFRQGKNNLFWEKWVNWECQLGKQQKYQFVYQYWWQSTWSFSKFHFSIVLCKCCRGHIDWNRVSREVEKHIFKIFFK